MTVAMGHVLVVAHSSYGVTNSPSALTVVMNSAVRVSYRLHMHNHVSKQVIMVNYTCHGACVLQN